MLDFLTCESSVECGKGKRGRQGSYHVVVVWPWPPPEAKHCQCPPFKINPQNIYDFGASCLQMDEHVWDAFSYETTEYEKEWQSFLYHHMELNEFLKECNKLSSDFYYSLKPLIAAIGMSNSAFTSSRWSFVWEDNGWRWGRKRGRKRRSRQSFCISSELNLQFWQHYAQGWGVWENKGLFRKEICRETWGRKCFISILKFAISCQIVNIKELF